MSKKLDKIEEWIYIKYVYSLGGVVMMSLERFLRTGLRVAKRSTGYKYIKMFEGELRREGLIDVRVVGKGKRIFVKDTDKILSFFEEKGIYL